MAGALAVQSWWGYDDVVNKLAIRLSLVMCFSLLGNAGASAVSAPKPGSKCSVLKTVKTVDKKSFTCISSNGKKVWSKGSLVNKTKKPSVGNSRSNSLNPGADPKPTPSPSTGAKKKITPSYSFSTSGMSANKIKSGESIEVSFKLTSNDPTVSTPTALIDLVTGHTEATLVSGNKSSGRWRAELTIPENTFAGSYRVYLAVVGYSNGEKNEEWLTVGNIAISGPTKLVPFYRFSSIVINKTKVSPGDSVTVTFEHTSNDSTAEAPYAYIDGVVGPTQASNSSGTNMSGVWTANLQVPANAFAGTYNVVLLGMGEANGEKNDDRINVGSVTVE